MYVGETRRTAAQRVEEHKSDTRLGHLDKSAVAEHAHTTGHHVHWKAMVVEREQHGRKRKIKEALHIHSVVKIFVFSFLVILVKYISFSYSHSLGPLAPATLSTSLWAHF